MRKIIGAALAVAAIAATGAHAAGTNGGTGAAMTAERGTVAVLRQQNDALRERMGQMQLDLLIADVLSGRDPKAARVARTDLRAAPQVVAFRK